MADRYDILKIFRNHVFEFCRLNNQVNFTCWILCVTLGGLVSSQVFSVPIGGMLVRQKVSAGGSGSSYIYGYLDSQFKDGMKRDECVEFVKKGELFFQCDFSQVCVLRFAVVFFSLLCRLAFDSVFLL